MDFLDAFQFFWVEDRLFWALPDSQCSIFIALYEFACPSLVGEHVYPIKHSFAGRKTFSTWLTI